MAKHLVLVGGGLAHLGVLEALGDFTSRGHQVTLVTAAPRHEFSGMAPGVLAGRYKAEAFRIDVAALARRGRAEFLADRVTEIFPDRRQLRTAGGLTLDYDLASFAVGSEVPVPPGEVPDGRVWPVRPLANWQRLHDLVAAYSPGSERNLLVIGGGPAGVEGAGALATLVRNRRIHGQVILVTGGQLLAGAPEALRAYVRRSLQRRGVEILERTVVAGFDGVQARLSNGRELYFDLALVATGGRAPGWFREAGLRTGSHCGGFLVNRCLQSLDHPELLGGGDCISFAEKTPAKVGVHALRQGEVLRHNLLAALEGKILRAVQLRPRTLLICNLGDETGALQRGSLVLNGSWALQLKEWIDFRFMNRFSRGSLHGRLSQEGAG